MPIATTAPTVRSQPHPQHPSLRLEHRPRLPRRPDHRVPDGPPAVAPVRVLLAGPHPVLRVGLRELLDRTPDLELTADAPAVAHVPALIAQLRPDVVLIDLDEPVGDALEAVRAVAAAARPATPVLALASRRQEDAMVAAVRAGARGYAVKDVGEADLVAQIRLVAAGGAGFSAGIADRLLELVTTANPRPGDLAELTEREFEVLEWLAVGAANKQIAHRLSLSPKTVRNYVSSLCTKLGVVDRTRGAPGP